MTPKERIKAAVNFEETDQVPASIFDGGVWLTAQENISLQDMLDMDKAGYGLLKKSYERFPNSGMIFLGSGLAGLGTRALGGTVNFSRVGNSAQSQTLLSDISEIHNYDASKIREQLEACEEFQKLLSGIEQAKKDFGDKQYIAAIGGAPFSTAGVMVGVQNMMELIFDEDENLPALFEYATQRAVITSNMFVEHGADVVCMADPVASGDLIGLPMFKELVMPLLKKAFDAVHGAELKMLHICGNTKPCLESLRELDIDIFSLDSVDIREAMALADGHYAILGNMSPFAIVADKTAEEVSAIGAELCRQAGNHGGFILSSGCDLPPSTPLENVYAMLNAPALA